MSKRVLIVDDEEMLCSVLQDLLEDSGYSVTTAPSLSSARSEIGHDELPDVVVVDMTLPDGSGVSLLHELKTNERTKSIPIIMITAHTVEKIARDTVGDQPDDCILKPFNLRDFKARLEKQIQAHP